MTRLALTALMALLITGCSWFGDDEELKPADLVDFETTITVKQLWSVKVGKGMDIPGVKLSPAFADGRLFAASTNGIIQSMDPQSGRTDWRIETDLPISAGPSVADDLLVVGTIDGEVIAYQAGSGSELWRSTASSEILAAPAVHNGMVVVRSQDGRVFGLNGETGAREWIFDRSVPLLSLRGNSAPVARGGYAFIGFDSGKIAALKVDSGTLAWEQTVAAPDGRTELERIVDVDGQLAVVASDLYAVSYQGRLASLTADSGRLLWVRDLSSSTGVTVSRSQLNVTDSDDAVWALDRLSGGTLWKQDRLIRRSITGPARMGDSVVVGDYEGYLHFISDEDGSFQARIKADGQGLRVAPVSVGDTIYVYGASGKLAAYRAG
jgi:outer membrane protein assembly factor BamB